MMNFRMGITLQMINFKTIGIPEKRTYHQNQGNSLNFSCGCWQCCKIDSANNLATFDDARKVYEGSYKWLDHHYD